jgi:hypothetical protein
METNPSGEIMNARRRTRTAAAIAALALAVVTTAVASAPSSSAMAKIKCKQTTGTAAVDPIVHHNETSAMVHVHQFFGNNAWLAKGNSANYSDLEGKTTNCENTADTAGYWVPQLTTLSGTPVKVQAFTAYYRPFTGVGGPDFGPAEVIPADTRLVATDYDWSCGQFSNTGPQPSIPSCVGQSGKPGHTLTAHVTFPTCWDGKLPNHASSDVGNTADGAHWAYKVRTSGKNYTCPSGFSHKMTELRETIQYAYTGNGTDLKLSSDAMAGTSDGRSLHADFWNTWEMTGFTSMVKNCVNSGGDFTAAECG